MPQYDAIDSYDSAPLPLFGTSTRRERLVNLIVGIVCLLLVVFTVVSAFIKAHNIHHYGLNVFFAACILIFCLSLLLLIHWYRQGDVDPKFRKMIYLNAFSVILICICANLYFHDIGVAHCPNVTLTTVP